MSIMHYIGFDIHKKVISFCEKQIDGKVIEQGMISATREALTDLVKTRKHPWVGAMEATLYWLDLRLSTAVCPGAKSCTS